MSDDEMPSDVPTKRGETPEIDTEIDQAPEAEGDAAEGLGVGRGAPISVSPGTGLGNFFD